MQSNAEICIMKMDAGLDTGDVLLRKSYEIAPGTTAGMLHDRLSAAAPSLLLETLAQIAAGKAEALPQVDVGVTYAQKISKEETKLDFSQPASVVMQKILGLSPLPGAWFEENGERVKVLEASMEHGPFELNCNPGTIYPTALQRAGGKRIGVAEFLAGRR